MALTCPKCKQDTLELPDDHGRVMCRCNPAKAQYEYYRFPAYFREDHAPLSAERVSGEGESTCYNHPDKVAVDACNSCGMFACSLCLMESEQGQICLNCFDRGQKSKGKEEKNAHTRRVPYDTIALTLAVLPIITVYFTLFTAPIAIFMVIRYWKNHPCSEVPRTRIRYYLAFFIALVQILVWIAFFIGLAVMPRSGY